MLLVVAVVTLLRGAMAADKTVALSVEARVGVAVAGAGVAPNARRVLLEAVLVVVVVVVAAVAVLAGGMHASRSRRSKRFSRCERVRSRSRTIRSWSSTS